MLSLLKLRASMMWRSSVYMEWHPPHPMLSEEDTSPLNRLAFRLCIKLCIKFFYFIFIHFPCRLARDGNNIICRSRISLCFPRAPV